MNDIDKVFERARPMVKHDQVRLLIGLLRENLRHIEASLTPGQTARHAWMVAAEHGEDAVALAQALLGVIMSRAVREAPME